MPDPVDLVHALGLPPKRAIEYFRSKGYRITFSWDSMEAEAHARAFTVAKAMRLEVLQTIRGELDRAISTGTTLRDFQRTLEPRLKALGWWGKQVMERPDGTGQLVQTGSPRRLRTIYQTNLQSAYMAGRYRDAIENEKARGFGQYVAIMDLVTRPSHAALHGRIFRLSDPIWRSCWPPNGYNCRCRVRMLSQRDIDAKGLSVSESGADLVEFEDADPSTGVIFPRVSYKAPGMSRAFAPDRGFTSNSGLAGWQPTLERYPPPMQGAYLDEALQGPAFDLFLKGATSETFPIARVSERLAAALEVDQAVVRFSAQTRDKNIAAHPDLTIDDYRFARTVVEHAQLAVKDGPMHMVLVRREGVWWVAAVKRTLSGKAVFLQSFRRSSEEDVRRLKARGIVLWDEAV